MGRKMKARTDSYVCQARQDVPTVIPRARGLAALVLGHAGLGHQLGVGVGFRAAEVVVRPGATGGERMPRDAICVNTLCACTNAPRLQARLHGPRPPF